MANYSKLSEAFLFPSFYFDEKRFLAAASNKTILITGASYGIGEEVTYLLSQAKNIRFILVARSLEKLQQIKSNVERVDVQVTIIKADLKKEEDVTAVTKIINEQFSSGGIDIFISNAGKSIRRSLNDSIKRMYDFTELMHLNYFAPVQIILSIIPALQKTKGQIINITGIDVLLPPAPCWSAYQASKTAMDSWFKSIAVELKEKDIITTSVYFSLVKTRMIRPTEMYQNMPAMNVQYAAKVIGRSIYKMQKKYTPWWFFFVEIFAFCFKKLFVCLIDSFNKRN